MLCKVFMANCQTEVLEVDSYKSGFENLNLTFSLNFAVTLNSIQIINHSFNKSINNLWQIIIPNFTTLHGLAL